MTAEEPNGHLTRLYNALKTPRRRNVLYALKTSETPVVSVRHLAKEIAAKEHGLPAQYATGEPYRNVYNALSQTHLPTLANAGIVIYDSKRQMVSRGPHFTTATLILAVNSPIVHTLDSPEADT